MVGNSQDLEVNLVLLCKIHILCVKSTRRLMDRPWHSLLAEVCLYVCMYVKYAYMYTCVYTYMKRRNEEIQKHKKIQKITTGMDYRKTQFYKKEISWPFPLNKGKIFKQLRCLKQSLERHLKQWKNSPFT